MGLYILNTEQEWLSWFINPWRQIRQLIPYPHIDPDIIKVGPLAVRWYGVMYLIGFAVSYFLVHYQLRRKQVSIRVQDIDSLFLYLLAGLVIGARLGYVIFYNLISYLEDPLEMFAVWHGGMSFHGGMIGSVVAGIIFCRKYRADFWQLSDLIIVTAPIGLGLGRIGNFINGELYGRVTAVPWAMVFPSGGLLPRHPSQLYEFLLEGVLLFSLLWVIKDKDLKSGSLTSIFLILYGLFRFFIEFYRQPDPQIGFISGYFTMGQVLSLAMILFGFGILFSNKGRGVK
jgi:phosphatidylglycerol---prolipoprotein diacylglyceryl transferase